MKKLLFLSLAALLSAKAYSQTPYRLYGYYEKALFTNHYDNSALNVFSLKPADTQPSNGDSVFVKKYNLMQKDITTSPYFFSCDGSFNDTLWHGNALVLAADGRQLLTTAQNDTLTIRAMSSLGQTWKALQYSNGTYWQAQVDSVSLQNVLGLTDSVKTISFWKKAANGTSVSDDNNGAKMKISRQYGLVSTPSILNFPTEQLQLAGFDNPQKGVQNLTAAQIYDMQVGDEFHIVDLFDANYPYGMYGEFG